MTTHTERWWRSEQYLRLISQVALIVSIAGLALTGFALKTAVDTSSQRAADQAATKVIAKVTLETRASQCDLWAFQAGAATLPDGGSQPAPSTQLGWTNRVYGTFKYRTLGCSPAIPDVNVPKEFQ